MSKIYVVIDVGCHECGVGSEVIKAYKSKAAADKKARAVAGETGCWRDGGQSVPEVFEVEL
jgi:hypothetical protein